MPCYSPALVRPKVLATMDMVKVDPKLFATCRLCLEDMGMYQITPVVQQQIKYCFDIDVDQFDGLPQLICEQCETILSEYFTRKRIFVGRQNALKAKLQVRKEIEGTLCPSPPHEAVSSSQQYDNEEQNNVSIPKAKKRKYRILSSSSSSTQISRVASASPVLNSEKLAIERKKKCYKKHSKCRRESWEANYTKRYACKLCNKHLKVGAGFTNHLKIHANLFSKYRDILKRSCKVELIKIDGKPNSTGNNKTVVLCKNRIIGPQKENVCVLYLSPEDKNNTENTESVCLKPEDTTNLESDDGEEIIPMSSNAKRRRLLSRSSTDTVVLNDDNKSPVTSDVEIGHKRVAPNAESQTEEEIECINIDDSSNGSHQSDCVPLSINDSVPVKPKDIEAIKNLIKVCHNKYVSKRQELIEIERKKAANNGSHLKHKLLSMGRKMINRKGLPCTGLLRFMESKNLAVKWIPMMATNKDNNYARIMATQKGKDELNPENLGWKKIHGQYLPKDENLQIVPKLYFVLTQVNLPATNSTTNKLAKNNFCKVSVPGSNAGKIHQVNKSGSEAKTIPSANELPNINPDETWNSNNVGNASPITSHCKIVPARENHEESSGQSEVMLYTDPDTKLLNANPVANPKQLPKKINVTDTKLYNQAINAVEHYYSQTNENIDESVSLNLEADRSDIEMCMPIITSTTSLAISSTSSNTHENYNKSDNDPKSSTENTKEVEKPAPRIKVKPNSELMSESFLKNLCEQPTPNNIWVPGTSTAKSTTGLNMINIARVGQVQPNDHANLNATSEAPANIQRRYVILDTVDLPNTKTDSPIQYFRNLLQIRNIILLDCDASLPMNANCLIKFKLQFLRDTVNQPVTLCLSVHCAGNMFSFAVRDPNQLNNIDLNKLSANWQWEILKSTVRQDVINKMLQNAQKISQEVYENTNMFIFLLKSINKITVQY